MVVGCLSGGGGSFLRWWWWGFDVGTVCGRELYKGLAGVYVRWMVFVRGDFFWR